MRFTSSRRGFTLVELLIVIVVIGILSAMMMMSSSEAVSSAKATAIISDLRNLKTAALAYFADHIDTELTRQPATSGETVIPIDDILVYLNGKEFPNKDSYKVIAGYDISSWFVECNVGDGNKAVVKGTEAAAVRRKLAGRAKSVGLLSTREIDAPPYDGAAGRNEGNNVKHGGMYVFMLVQ